MVVSCFSKRFIIDIWQWSEYTSGSEYSRVPSPGFWICLWFWMCQSFGYTKVFNMPLVLNMPGFEIYQSSEYARVAQGWEYAWLCMNLSECVWICLNLPEWFLFYISPFPHLFYNPFSTWTHVNVYRRLEFIVWRNMKLFSCREKIWLFL